jgi:hypothetical protein
MTPRREDWPDALNDWVDAHRTTPFAWGVWDCCAAAADWLRVCTGSDCFAAFAGKYADVAGAARLIHSAGGIKNIVWPFLGAAIGAVYAQRGDLVLVAIEGRESLAVCLGNTAAGPGEDGMVFVQREGWLCAWKV